MHVLVYGKDKDGMPTTERLADLTDRVSDLSMTTAAMWGPLEARLSIGVSREEGFDIAENWLGCPVEVWAPDGEWCWEGLIWTVRFGSGRRSRTRSLEGYKSQVRVLYQDAGVSSSITATLAVDGQPRYGTIEYVHAGGSISATTAAYLSTAQLALRSRLLYLPERSGGGDLVEIECVGWYRTLGYLPYTSATLGELATESVISDILTANAPFILDDYTNFAATGTVASRTYDANETPMQIIRRLIESTDGFVFGIGQGRVPYIQATTRLSSQPDYLEQPDGTITDVAGNRVPPWLLQPNRILRQVDFVPPTLPVAAIDSIESIWLSEVRAGMTDVDYSASVAGVNGVPVAY